MPSINPVNLLSMGGSTISGFNCGVFFCLALCYLDIPAMRSGKVVSILLPLQLFLVGIIALCQIIKSLVPGIDCKLMGHFSFILFPIWVTLIEAILLMRAMPFANDARIYKAITFICWTGRWCTELYTNAKIFVISEPLDFCVFATDFSLSFWNLGFRITSELTLLLPFLETMYRQRANKDQFYWVSVHNGISTTCLIGTEVIVNIIVQNGSMFPYLTVIFSICNLIEGITILFLIEDMKHALTHQANQITYSLNIPSAIAQNFSIIKEGLSPPSGTPKGTWVQPEPGQVSVLSYINTAQEPIRRDLSNVIGDSQDSASPDRADEQSSNPKGPETHGDQQFIQDNDNSKPNSIEKSRTSTTDQVESKSRVKDIIRGQAPRLPSIKRHVFHPPSFLLAEEIIKRYPSNNAKNQPSTSRTDSEKRHRTE